MHKARFLLILAVLFILVLAGSVVAQDSDMEEAEPIVFGFIVDETGVGAIFAESQLVGLEIAMEDLNERGGILGRPVEFIKQDSQLDPATGANIARQFILEEGVEFLIGPTSSGVALAVSEIARENQVPIAFHTSNSVALSTTQGHEYMVQVVPNTDIEGRAIAQYLADLGEYEFVASIGPDYSFGRDSFAAFSGRLGDASDAEIITEQWPALSERDLNPFITAISANGPEVLHSSLWGDQLVTFVLQANDFGLFDEMQFAGLFDLDFMKAIGDELPEGLIGFSRAPFYAIDSEEMDAFLDKYLEKTDGVYPSDWAIMIYDAVMALAAAAEEAGTVDGPAVAEALGGLTFMSLRGELTIRDCDRMANVGEYIGRTVYVDEYPFPILEDVVFVPAEDVRDSCEEIEAMRAGNE